MAVPTELCLWTQVEGQICPTGHTWLVPALRWGQSDLSKRLVEPYLLSYSKTFSASPSALLLPKPRGAGPLPVPAGPARAAPSCLQSPGHVVLSIGLIPSHTCPLSPEGCLSSCPRLLGMQLISVDPAPAPFLSDGPHSLLHARIHVAVPCKALGEQLLCARKGLYREK